jgi:hypothetical protein
VPLDRAEAGDLRTERTVGRHSILPKKKYVGHYETIPFICGRGDSLDCEVLIMKFMGDRIRNGQISCLRFNE